jgi:hypothetical protein
MKFVVGRSYRTKGGHVAEITSIDEATPGRKAWIRGITTFPSGKKAEGTWDLDGKHPVFSELDLTEEFSA